MIQTNNPLLEFAEPGRSGAVGTDPTRSLPRFSDIRPEHVQPALEALLADNRAQREQLLSRGSRYTWDNLAQPLEDMSERLSRMWSPVSHLNSVMNNEALREVYNECLPKLSEYFTELAQDERIYTAYKEIKASPAYRGLSAAQKKIIDNTLRDFRLAGAELPAAKKARFKDVQMELSQLQSKYSENVLDATQAWDLMVIEEARLSGLPETARALAQQSAQSVGKPGWRFTLEFPSYLAIMTYADQRELRRQMYEAFVTRASDQGPHAGRWDNGPLMVQICKLRQEAAELLGFAHYAEYALQTRMAKTVPEVMDFLDLLAARSRPAARHDLEQLRRFAKEAHGVAELAPWDLAYYGEKLRQARYDISQEQVRPYLPDTRVLAGLFQVVQRLYGLTIRPLDGIDVWHQDVRVYEIRDDAGEVRGLFYLDLYARANKRGGAWMDDCIGRKRLTTGVQVPVAYLTCNFTPPLNGRPALLTHDEVTTLFHEFGHGLHHMLTRVDYLGVAGINGVAWDAVELPSQFMENWCWEREAMALLSGHHETHAPLPDALFDKMHAARNFQSGMQSVRQLEFAIFDMRLHAGPQVETPEDIRHLLDQVRQEVAVVIPPAYNRFQNGFSHVFAGGYAAGYYSYKWAEVLSADAFSKFEERGVFDRATGGEFLRCVLEQGGVYEPMDLFVKFRGRKPTIDALLRHTGLAA